MAEWNPRANDIFVRAAEIDLPADRRLFVDQQCNGDAALRAQVESLLAAGGQVGSFLDRPAVGPRPFGQTAAYPPLTEGPGTVVGPYKLLQHIGEGGFGAVYMAEQEHPVRRKVALKIIKPGMDTREVIARFEAERQALAMMDHPNIARVFDAGATESGRPYFVMELVRGVPITEFCDRNKLPAAERLRLFVTVCHAIQHAHHKGIIHRDIKPSNVMITLHDGVPVVKVIDFGVAKATAQKLTERTLFTAYGQMVGTPAYMSPEQAEMSGLDIDTRSDIFSLGVLLYELLTGTTPLDSKQLRQAGYAEMQRLIREEEAPRPSTRFSSLGGAATARATNRGTDVKRLSQLLRSDLDWIVMKSLEKDRNRRYGSPANFAADVERFLTEQPVEARPPSAWYRFRKAARRNKVALTTATMVAAALVVGTAVSVWQAAAALAERDEKERARLAEAEQRAAAVKAADEATAATEKLRNALYDTDVQTAASFWQAYDRRRTLDMLDHHRPRPGEPDLRGFEWHFLNREMHSAVRTLTLPTGPKHFTPDGRRLYVTQFANRRTDGRPISTFRIWDLTTGKERPEWEPCPGEKVSFLNITGFNQTGSRALVRFGIGDFQGSLNPRVPIMLFDLETHKVLFDSREQPNYHPPGTVLDREGRLLALPHRGDDKDLPPRAIAPPTKVNIWNVDERKVIRTIELDAAKAERFIIPTLTFHPNGKQFAAVVYAADGKTTAPFQLRVWDVLSGAEVWGLPIEARASAVTVTYSPDGKYLAEARPGSNGIYFRNPDSGNVVHTLRIPGTNSETDQKHLAFSPDGSRLAVSLQSQKGVHIWNIPAGPSVGELQPFRSIPTGPSTGYRVSFTANNPHQVVVTSYAGDAAYYDLGSKAVALSSPDNIRKPASQWVGDREPVMVVAPSGHNGLAWALWRLESPGTPKVELRGWDATGREAFRLQCDSLEGRFAGFLTRDARRYVLIQSVMHETDPAKDRARIQVWDVKEKAELSVGELPGGLISMWGIDPDGKTIAISRQQETRPSTPENANPYRTRLSLWDVSANRELHGVDVDGMLTGAAMSSDGSRVAWSIARSRPDPRSELRVWDTATGQDVWTRNEWGTLASMTRLGAPRFSSDGKTLVVATGRASGQAVAVNGFLPVQGGLSEAQLHILDAATGSNSRPPGFSPDGVLDQLRISADGRRLFALASSGTRGRRPSESVVVWDLVTGRKLLTLPTPGIVRHLTIDRAGQRVFLMKESAAPGKLSLETLDGTPLGDDNVSR